MVFVGVVVISKDLLEINLRNYFFLKVEILELEVIRVNVVDGSILSCYFFKESW